MEDKMNLRKETIQTLKENGKTGKDVLWVGDKFGKDSGFYSSGSYGFNGIKTWTEFKKWANFKYDNGYGGEEISLKMKVVGRNWWLERHEYDGSEWWKYKAIPIKKDFKSKQ